MQNRISPFQCFSLLFISRIISTLTFIPSAASNGSEYIISALLGSLIALVLSLPLYYLSSRGFALNEKHRFLSLLISVYLIFLFINNVSRLCLFAGSVRFEQINPLLLLSLTLAAVLFVTRSGIEALARLGFAGAIVISVSLVIIALSLTGNFSILNLQPLTSDSPLGIIKLSFSVASRTVEPLFLFLLMPKINGGIKKGFFIWWGTNFSFVIMLTVCLVFSLGGVSFRMLFPYHAMAELSNFAVSERMDSLLSCVWIFGSFLKCCLYLYLVSQTASIKLKEKTIAYICTALCFLISAFLLGNVNAYRIFNNIALRETLYAVFVLLIPTVILFIDKKHLRRKI